MDDQKHKKIYWRQTTNAPLGQSLTSVLVALNGGGIAFELDDLADQFVPTDLDELVHFGA
jgi:hypothetical protein